MDVSEILSVTGDPEETVETLLAAEHEGPISPLVLAQQMPKLSETISQTMTAVYRAQTAVYNSYDGSPPPPICSAFAEHRSKLKGLWANKTNSIVSCLLEGQEWASDYVFLEKVLAEGKRDPTPLYKDFMRKINEVKASARNLIREQERILSDWKGMVDRRMFQAKLTKKKTLDRDIGASDALKQAGELVTNAWKGVNKMVFSGSSQASPGGSNTVLTKAAVSVTNSTAGPLRNPSSEQKEWIAANVNIANPDGHIARKEVELHQATLTGLLAELSNFWDKHEIQINQFISRKHGPLMLGVLHRIGIECAEVKERSQKAIAEITFVADALVEPTSRL